MNFPPEALERIRKNREEARITADPSTAESGSLVREAVVAGNALCHLAVSIPAAAAPARGTREQAQDNHREGIHRQCLKEVINEELLGDLKQAAESGVAARHGGPLSKVVSKLQNSEVAVKLPMRDGNPAQTEPDEEKKEVAWADSVFDCVRTLPLAVPGAGDDEESSDGEMPPLMPGDATLDENGNIVLAPTASERCSP